MALGEELIMLVEPCIMQLGDTALMIASKIGSNIDKVDILLAAGANKNATNKVGAREQA